MHPPTPTWTAGHGNRSATAHDRSHIFWRPLASRRPTYDASPRAGTAARGHARILIGSPPGQHPIYLLLPFHPRPRRRRPVQCERPHGDRYTTGFADRTIFSEPFGANRAGSRPGSAITIIRRRVPAPRAVGVKSHRRPRCSSSSRTSGGPAAANSASAPSAVAAATDLQPGLELRCAGPSIGGSARITQRKKEQNTEEIKKKNGGSTQRLTLAAGEPERKRVERERKSCCAARQRRLGIKRITAVGVKKRRRRLKLSLSAGARAEGLGK